MRRRHRNRALRKARSDARRTMSAFRLILGLAILFFISQVLPYVIKPINIIVTGGKNQDVRDKFSFNVVLIQLAELILGILYPCFNPVAFIYCDKRLRRSLSRLTNRCSSKKKKSVHHQRRVMVNSKQRNRSNRIQPIDSLDSHLYK